MKALLSRRRFEALALAIALLLGALHLWSTAQPAIASLGPDTFRTGWLARTALGDAVLRAVHALEGKAVDQKFHFRGRVKPPRELVIVEVDERSAQRFGLWPWPRPLVARGLDALREAGVEAVGVDAIFTDAVSDLNRPLYAEMLEEVSQSMAEADGARRTALASLRTRLGALENPDAVLGEAFRAFPSAVQGVMAYSKRDAEELVTYAAEQEAILAPRVLTRMAGAIPGTYFEVDPAEVPSLPFHSAQTPRPGLIPPGGRLGHLNALPDSDGTLRRMPLLVRLDRPNGFVPSLDLQTAAAFFDAEVELELDPVRGQLAAARLVRGDEIVRRVPISHAEPYTWINHLGPGEESFERVSFADVIERRVSRERLEGKVALVGVTLVGSFDQRVTPFSEYEPGVYAHASMLSNILTGDFLERPAGIELLELLFMLASALGIAWILPRVRFTLKLVTVAALAGGYLLADKLAFDSGVVMSTVLPVTNVLVSAFGMIFLGYLSVDREKARLRNTFQHYLNPSVMQQMLQHPEMLRLGGEKREMTVLFSDIRGFTTLSERMTPEALVKLINSYLTPMTEIVFEEGGTLDKYIGDALMAFWSAPLEQEDHALRACRAALRFVERMETLREGWRAERLPDFDIGVGINTGPMVVGNMGSDVRFDYTVMGDAVNLAARLEGTNKEYGTRLLISEGTFAQVQGRVVARRLGAVRVKGKRKPVRIYELRGMGEPSGDEAALIETFEGAVDAFAARRFDEAKVAFERVLTAWENDVATHNYLDQIAAFEKTPPGPQWDGVYTATTK